MNYNSADKVIHHARVYASKTADLVPAGRLRPGPTVLRSVDTLSLFSGSARGPHPNFLGRFAEQYGFISARLIRNAAGLSDTSEAWVQENLLFLAAVHFKFWILFAWKRLPLPCCNLSLYPTLFQDLSTL